MKVESKSLCSGINAGSGSVVVVLVVVVVVVVIIIIRIAEITVAAVVAAARQRSTTIKHSSRAQLRPFEPCQPCKVCYTSDPDCMASVSTLFRGQNAILKVSSMHARGEAIFPRSPTCR